MKLWSDSIEVQCANAASLKANSWLQAIIVNIEQLKLLSQQRLTGNLLVVSLYKTDYDKYCPEYILTAPL